MFGMWRARYNELLRYWKETERSYVGNIKTLTQERNDLLAKFNFVSETLEGCRTERNNLSDDVARLTSTISMLEDEHEDDFQDWSADKKILEQINRDLHTEMDDDKKEHKIQMDGLKLQLKRSQDLASDLTIQSNGLALLSEAQQTKMANMALAFDNFVVQFESVRTTEIADPFDKIDEDFPLN